MGGSLPVVVLTVNAGSTSLKLHLVRGDDSEPVDGFERVQGADAVGHRVVHGGPRLQAPCVLDAGVEAEVERASVLAPLHNGPALEAIRRARAALPGVPHVAVFDTGFHRTMPPAASTYASPGRGRGGRDRR